MIKAVIFDKDGTLIELGTTWDKPTVSMLRDLLGETNLSQDDKDKLAYDMGIKEDWSGIKANSIFAAGSILDQAQYLQPFLDKSIMSIVEEMEALYLKYLLENNLEAKLTTGSEELLKLLSQDYYIGLVTNDHYIFTRRMLKDLGILHYFDFIGCADQYGPKPNPRAFHEMSRRFNIEMNEMIYVGDSSLDMEYAKHTKAGIGFLESSDSYKHLKEADYLIHDMMEIPEIIQAINHKEEEGCIP